MKRRGRKPLDPEIKKRALELIKSNPTLSMERVARHFEISSTTVSKWFEEANLKRWGC